MYIYVNIVREEATKQDIWKARDCRDEASRAIPGIASGFVFEKKNTHEVVVECGWPSHSQRLNSGKLLGTGRCGWWCPIEPCPNGRSPWNASEGTERTCIETLE